MLIRIPFEMKKRGGKREIKATTKDQPADWSAQKPLLINLALAHEWQAALDRGDYPTINALARHIGVDFSYLSRMLNLTYLDPYIIESIVNGQEPSGTSLARLHKDLPLNWDAQRRKHGFAERKDANEVTLPSNGKLDELEAPVNRIPNNPADDHGGKPRTKSRPKKKVKTVGPLPLFEQDGFN